MNYFPDNPDLPTACKRNSAPLISMLDTCYQASGKRWPNFIAVDFYKVLYHVNTLEQSDRLSFLAPLIWLQISCREVMEVEHPKQ